MIFKSGNIYEGEWNYYAMHGKGINYFIIGTMNFDNREVYKGDWVNNTMEGEGLY